MPMKMSMTMQFTFDVVKPDELSNFVLCQLRPCPVGIDNDVKENEVVDGEF